MMGSRRNHLHRHISLFLSAHGGSSFPPSAIAWKYHLPKVRSPTSEAGQLEKSCKPRGNADIVGKFAKELGVAPNI